MGHLPRKRNGKIRVEEFINLPIISEDAFKAIDRNKDGVLTRGELKLTNKDASMGEVVEVMNFLQVFSNLETWMYIDIFIIWIE